MTTSSAEETAWGSRHWRRPTPVVTRSISSRNNAMVTDNIRTCLPTLVRCSRSRKRPRISWQSSNLISKLGDDLLEEILIRSFPDPKSACRCKAVCKQWSSLISCPSFNRRFVSHHQMKNNNTKLLLQNELVSVISNFLPPMPDSVTVGGQTLHVFDCFKDLVLCGFWDVVRRIGIGKPIRSYLICNPFTQKWIALPLAPSNYGCGPLVARLVCEPSISTTLDLGRDEQEQSPFIYSEYRFRVVCMYEEVFDSMALKLDVFCSESGEWISRALVLHSHMMRRLTDPCLCNGQLFWTSRILRQNSPKNLVGMFNPSRLDIPPTFIDASSTLLIPGSRPAITVSQDALYLIPHSDTDDGHDLALVIWKLDVQEDGKHSWKKQREVLVKKEKKNKNKCWCGCERKVLAEPILHPSNPEIVFFKCFACKTSLYSLDLSMEEEAEMKLLGTLEKLDGDRFLDYYHKVFEPKLSCWPTPIPTYKELPQHIRWDVAATAKQQLNQLGRDGRAELRSSTFSALKRYLACSTTNQFD